MPRHFNLLKLLLPVFILGCSSNLNKENVVLREVISGLESSNININKSSQIFLKDLEDKLTDPATAERAKLWNAKAQEVSKLSGEIYNYLKEIINALKSASSKEGQDSEKSFNAANKSAVTKILFTENRGGELITKMKNHRENLYMVDSNLRLAFQDSYPFSLEHSADYFFKGSTVLESVAFLTRMQNAIKIIENRMIAFCYYKVPDVFDGWYDYYSSIIGQSSSVVKPGEKIQITAGIGAFSKKANPEIIIDGLKIPIDETGMAIYKFKSSSIIGKHSKKVKISYVNEYGKPQSFEQVVEYTVSDCKNQ